MSTIDLFFDPLNAFLHAYANTRNWNVATCSLPNFGEEKYTFVFVASKTFPSLLGTVTVKIELIPLYGEEGFAVSRFQVDGGFCTLFSLMSHFGKEIATLVSEHYRIQGNRKNFWLINCVADFVDLLHKYDQLQKDLGLPVVFFDS